MPVVSERCIWLSGCSVALSWVRSHVMGWMKAQSEPAGQQMTDLTSSPFKDMQVEPVGQQKSDGKLLPHCSSP